MEKNKNDITKLIGETFDEYGIKYDVTKRFDSDQVLAGFPIDCGPSVTVRFIFCEGKGVAVRIPGLITNIPKDKRARVLEACNILNNKIRYVKFVLDGDGDISVEYDFLDHTPNSGIGEMAVEIFICMMRILDGEYSIFMKALYTDEALEEPDIHMSSEMIRKFEELCELFGSDADETEDLGGEDGFFDDGNDGPSNDTAS